MFVMSYFSIYYLTARNIMTYEAGVCFRIHAGAGAGLSNF